MRRFVLLIAVAMIELRGSCAFIARCIGSGGSGASHLSNLFLQDGNTEASSFENLILSLSKEPTDELRRARLQLIFEDSIQNQTPEKANLFASQFNQALIKVGDRTRQQALSEAETGEKQTPGNAASSLLDQKSETEFQLWALIDMMVQSKTIVKKVLS
jgi:hypothetical protein